MAKTQSPTKARKLVLNRYKMFTETGFIIGQAETLERALRRFRKFTNEAEPVRVELMAKAFATVEITT